MIYCIHGNVCPSFIFALFALIVCGPFPINVSNYLSLTSQLCLGKFESGQNHLQVKKGKNNPACTGIQ